MALLIRFKFPHPPRPAERDGQAVSSFSRMTRPCNYLNLQLNDMQHKFVIRDTKFLILNLLSSIFISYYDYIT